MSFICVCVNLLLALRFRLSAEYLLPSGYYSEEILLSVGGPFLRDAEGNESEHFLSMKVSSGDEEKFGSEVKLPIPAANSVDDVAIVQKRLLFRIDRGAHKRQKALAVHLWKSTSGGMTIKLNYDPTPIDIHVGVVFAVMILILFYALIISEANSIHYARKMRARRN